MTSHALKQLGIRILCLIAFVETLFLPRYQAWGTELISNGTFETGAPSPWILSGGTLVTSHGSLAHNGSYYLWFGDDNGTDTAYQTITIPSGASVATLSFYYLPKISEARSLVELKAEIRVGYRLVLPLAALMATLIYVFRHQIISLLFSQL